MQGHSNSASELNQEKIENNSKKIEIEYHQHGLYYVIPSQIMDSKLLSSTEKLCYALISGLAYQDGTCFPSDKYLAERLGVSIPTVKRVIKKFADLNLISKYTDRSNMMRPKRIIKILISISSKLDANDGIISDTNDGIAHDPIVSKEYIVSKDKRGDVITPPDKYKIKLTKDQKKKLIEKMGKEKVEDYITQIELYLKSIGQPKKYKCLYSTILMWERRDVKKKNSYGNQPIKSIKLIENERKLIEKIYYKYLEYRNKCTDPIIQNNYLHLEGDFMMDSKNLNFKTRVTLVKFIDKLMNGGYVNKNSFKNVANKEFSEAQTMMKCNALIEKIKG